MPPQVEDSAAQPRLNFVGEDACAGKPCERLLTYVAQSMADVPAQASESAAPGIVYSTGPSPLVGDAYPMPDPLDTVTIRGLPASVRLSVGQKISDTDWAFAYCCREDLPCTISVFEPGFVRLVDAHYHFGNLPRSSLVKLEFCSGDLLFGLTADLHGLQGWLNLFDHDALAWMGTLRNGSVNDHLAELAIALGGHVRVGLEDYTGPGSPRNADLVAAAADIAAKLGRRPARPDEVRNLITRKHQ